MAGAQAGVPVILHEMRPVRGTDAHKTDSLAELVCSNSFRSDDAETNAVGLLHAEMRLAGSLIMASGDAQPGSGRRRACRRPRRLFRGRHGEDRSASADHHRPRGNLRPAARGLGPGDHRHRPADGALAGAGNRRKGPAPTRWPSSMRSPRSCISRRSTWIPAGSSRATTRSGPAAPARIISTARWTRPQYEAFVAGAARRPEDRVQAVGRHALFRRLPADRGDGRARARKRCGTGR